MSQANVRPPSPVWLWIMPVIICGVLFLANGVAPGGLESLLLDLLPFLVTLWIGMGFTFAWDMLQYRMRVEGASRGIAAATSVLCALLLFAMIGGVRTLWEDPWLFGVAVAPGLRLVVPWIEARLAQGTEEDAP